MNALTDEGNCELCNRWKPLSSHHLIPRTCHSNKWFKKNFTSDEMHQRRAMLCRDCHHHIHNVFTEKELGRDFNTIEALKADAGIIKYAQWARKKK